ncbi:MAG: ankyrin repeat domain-containing protein [Candidatus Dependentiae bacterium]
MKKMILLSLLIASSGQLFSADFNKPDLLLSERLLAGVERQPDRELFASIGNEGKFGDYDRVKKLLSSSKGLLKGKKRKEDMPNVDAQNAYGWTPLMYAVIDPYKVKLVNLLIEKKADVNLVDEYGRTALMHAVQDGKTLENVKALIAAGADVNVQDVDGNTALMYAAKMYGQDALAKVNLLLEAGAEVNMQNNEGETAYLNAIDIHVKKALIDAGADSKIEPDYLLKDTGAMTKAVRPDKK